jgi:2'-5' RNA ligase
MACEDQPVMRLFVAVNLPPGERRAAFAATRRLREGHLPVKWVAEDALHVTLKFLGEVADDRAAPIGAALAEAVRTARPFEVALGGFGVFPDHERPRIFLLGIERHPALELLANDVELAMAGLGFEPELRPFQPHLTIGRARKDARASAFSALTELSAGIDYASMLHVGSVELMESTLGPAGPTYRIVHRAPLAGGGD